MTPEIDLTYNITGQSVYFDAPEGRPSSVTSVEIFKADESDDADGETAEDGAATIGDPNGVTLSSAAGPGQSDPHALVVSSAADIDSERIYLLSENEQREWIEPLKVDGTTLHLRHPLANDYTTSATVDSTRISQPLLSTWLQDENNVKRYESGPQYRVRWTYVVAGATYVAYSFFNLVRAKGTHTVTALDVDRYCNGFLDAIQLDYQRDQGRKLIQSAYDRVAIDLRREDIDDAALRDPMVESELVIRQTVVLWLQGDAYRSRGSLEALIDAREQYDAYLNQFVRLGGGVEVDTAGEGGAAPKAAGNILLR